MAAPLNIPSATAVNILSVNGGNLFRVALDHLGDALQWNRIAGANRLIDPFLPADTPLNLTIPPINFAASESGVLQGSIGVPVFSVATGFIGGVIPVNIEIPDISSPAQVGQILIATAGAWLNIPTSFAYQWYHSGLPIPGAMFATYIPIANDIGQPITVSVIATNSAGSSAPAISVATAAVVDIVPVDVTLPTIAGTAQVHQTLTASPGNWANDPMSFTYQWNRAGIPIAGATMSTYMPMLIDVGNTLTVSVVAMNTGGSSPPATSAPTAVVVDAGPTLIVNLAMSAGTLPLAA